METLNHSLGKEVRQDIKEKKKKNRQMSKGGSPEVGKVSTQ